MTDDLIGRMVPLYKTLTGRGVTRWAEPPANDNGKPENVVLRLMRDARPLPPGPLMGGR